jgi:hypothetical protein
MRRTLSVGLSALLCGGAVLAAAGVLVGAGGCSFSPAPEEAKVSLEPPVSAEDRAAAEHVVGAFAAAVRKGDYKAVRVSLTEAERGRAPATLAAWLEKGRYAPFTGARDWRYNEVTHLARGKKLLVRASFKGSDGADYRTTATLVPEGGGWRIDDLLAPTKPKPPVTAAGSAATAPGK